MKVYTIVFLIGALAFVSADNATTAKVEPEVLTTTVAPVPPTTLAPKTSSLPPPETTTTPPITTPSSTTEAPTTKPTTPAPTPPPTKPPTPAPPPAPTTKPTTTTTTTTPSTPTTPAPKPTPKEPEVGKWSLNYTSTDNKTTNFTCMTVQLALQTEVHYNTTANTTTVAYVNLPKNATVNGTCGSDPKSLAESMILTWNGNNTITLNFKKDNATSKFSLDQVVIALRNVTELPDSKLPSFDLVHKIAEFNTTGAKSYKCDKVQNLILSGAENKTEIHVSHVQMQAFTNTTNGAFQEAEDCQPFETPDVVPIAVGCSLVILVVIVLAAYLIGRRRREGRGYLSM